MICACAPEDGAGCGSDCLNRLVLSECDPAHCPCGSACGNQRMSRGESKETTVRRTGKKGHGLFAAERVGAGEFVLEYCGEVLHEEAYKERKRRYQDEGRSHYYFMTLSSSETIDATIRGNEGRFLNHSCAPNCETQKWMVRGELCIGIFATRDIAEGEELTIDYKFERFGEKPSRCYCMAGACCGWIGGAKAAEAAKAYDVDGDDDEGHEDDPEPIMRELDEALIAQEEAKGREQMADKYAPKKVAVKAENKSWRPPEEVREIERAAQGGGARRKPRVARGEIERWRWLQRPSRQDSRGFVRAKVERDVRRGEEADRGRSHHGGVAIHDWGVAFEGRRVALRAAFQLVLSSRRRRCDANQHARSRFDSRSDFVDEKSQPAARTRRRRRHVVLSKVHQRPRRSDGVRGARRASAQDFENLDGFDGSFQRFCHHSHQRNENGGGDADASHRRLARGERHAVDEARARFRVQVHRRRRHGTDARASARAAFAATARSK